MRKGYTALIRGIVEGEDDKMRPNLQHSENKHESDLQE